MYVLPLNTQNDKDFFIFFYILAHSVIKPRWFSLLGFFLYYKQTSKKKKPKMCYRVDFFIPGVEKVGGFSMCSSPALLQREGVVELAVKYSKHPPAHWVHTVVRRPTVLGRRGSGDQEQYFGRTQK